MPWEILSTNCCKEWIPAGVGPAKKTKHPDKKFVKVFILTVIKYRNCIVRSQFCNYCDVLCCGNIPHMFTCWPRESWICCPTFVLHPVTYKNVLNAHDIVSKCNLSVSDDSLQVRNSDLLGSQFLRVSDGVLRQWLRQDAVYHWHCRSREGGDVAAVCLSQKLRWFSASLKNYISIGQIVFVAANIITTATAVLKCFDVFWCCCLATEKASGL